MKKLNQKGFSHFEITLLVLVLAALGFAGYTVYQRNTKDINATTQTVVTTKETAKEATDNTSPADTTTNQTISLIAGQVDFDIDNRRGDGTSLYIDGYVKSAGELVAIWVQYGTSPSSLTRQTAKTTKELGLGDADTYSNFTFAVSKNSLDPGTDYFYQVVAETKDGTTLKSAVAGFTSRK